MADIPPAQPTTQRTQQSMDHTAKIRSMSFEEYQKYSSAVLTYENFNKDKLLASHFGKPGSSYNNKKHQEDLAKIRANQLHMEYRSKLFSFGNILF
jgi:hypothetical protein